MSDEAQKLPKPKMQGLLAAQIRRNVILALISSALGGFAFQFGYINRRKKIYADFYKDYDIEREFNRMRRKGLFDSCDPYEGGEDDDDNGE